MTEKLLHSEALSLTLKVLLHLVRVRRQWIVRAALLVAFLGIFAALLLPNLYTATVVVMPPQQSSSIGSALMSQLGSLGGLASMGAGSLGLKNPNDLQVSLLKSESVENAVIQRFQLEDEYKTHYLSKARKKWEATTHIDSGQKDGLLRLSVEEKNPERALQLANGWIEEYRRFVQTIAVTEAQQRRLFFDQQLKSAKDELARAEENLKETEQRTGVIQMDGQAHAMIESAAVMRAQIAAKEVEIRGLRSYATEQNPDLVRAEQELAGLEGQLAQMDVANKGRSGDLVAPHGSMTDAGLEYVRAVREVKYRETVYELLARQYEIARVDEAREGAPVQVVDPATLPDRPNSLYRIWIFVGALVCALPFGFLCAFLREAWSVLRRGPLKSEWNGTTVEQASRAA